MIRRLYYLNGLGILAVVVNHAAGWGQIALFLWVHRYLPVASPNWDKLGSLTYYILLTIRQLCVFAVPAFLFVSGFFVSYAARGTKNSLTWKVILTKIAHLIIPYLIWSSVVFIIDFLLGKTYTIIEYLTIFFTRGATGPYYFVPLLCYLYLLSPFFVYATKKNWKLVLFVSAFLQLGLVSLRYFALFGIEFPGLSFLLIITPDWLPLFSMTFFILGIIFGLHLESFKVWLTRNKRILFVALPITAVLTIIESDLLLRNTLEQWGANVGAISYHLYGVVAILCIMTASKIPFSKKITNLSNKSYGIYLIHMIVMSLLAKSIYHFTPQILAYQIIFVPLVFTFGLEVPLLLMAVVAKSPARRYYRYIFG